MSNGLLDEMKCPLDIQMSIRPLDEQKCPLDIEMSIRPLDEQKCPLDIRMSIRPLDQQKCPVDIQMPIGNIAEVLDMYGLHCCAHDRESFLEVKFLYRRMQFKQ